MLVSKLFWKLERTLNGGRVSPPVVEVFEAEFSPLLSAVAAAAESVSVF